MHKTKLEVIVEHADAMTAQSEIGFCNSGIMPVRYDLLLPLLVAVGNDNRKGKYYLTDIVHLARTQGHPIATAESVEDEVTGVNSQTELQALEQKLAKIVA
jgi:bifunctional N-acetylglucosamine-1-phosphate-uridyltransferase/glucosamine-1-phosphate-acetyltransferase GlmU-like protein